MDTGNETSETTPHQSSNIIAPFDRDLEKGNDLKQDLTPTSNVRQDYDSESDDDDRKVFEQITGPKTRRSPGARDSIVPLLDDHGSSDFPPPQSSKSAEPSRMASLISMLPPRVRANEGLILIALSQFCFSLVNVCVKLSAEQITIPVWEIILIRMSITWLGCYFYMRYAGIKYPFYGPPGVRLLLCVRGVTGFVGLASIYWALSYLSISDATSLTFIAPLICGFLAYFFLGEKYSFSTFFISLFSLVGVVLIAKPSFVFGARSDFVTGVGGLVAVTGAQRTTAVVVTLLGCFGAAGAYVTIRKIGDRAHSLHIISFFSIFCCIVSLLFPLVFDEPPVFIFSVRFVGYLIPIGVFGFIAQAFLTLGLQRETASRGSLAMYSHVLFAIILEYLVFGIPPDILSVVGASIIIASGIYIAMQKSK